MSSSVINKYLDVDSTYRDRTIFPLASDFDLPISFGAKPNNTFNSSDPVYLGYPFSGAINNTAAPLGVLTNTFTLDANFSNIDNVYSNSYLEINSLVLAPTYVKIINYVGSTRVATTESNVIIPAGPPAALVSIRPKLADVRDTLGAGSNNIQIQLGALASNIDNFYKGYILRLVTQGGLAFPSLNYGIINSYNGTTKIATLTLPISGVPPIAGDIYELINFSYDNYNPLIYSGTTVMTQPVCYAIELLYLTLPNKPIKNGNRGNLDTYPYFYVKLYNVNRNSSNHILLSNNPNTEFATFRIPMTLTLNRETFFTLRDAKCVQVIKFQPEQAIHFTVTLPNGEPIEFLTDDFYKPNKPNPYLQISAEFSLRRIDGN